MKTRQDREAANNSWRERAAKRVQAARGNGGGGAFRAWAVCPEIWRFAWSKISGSQPRLPDGISTRSRADHSRARISPARVQDASFSERDRRSFAHAPDPFDRGGLDQPNNCACIRAERRSLRSNRAGARSGSCALWPLRRRDAGRMYARPRRIRSQSAECTRGGTAGKSLSKFPRFESDVRSAVRFTKAPGLL